MLTRDSVTVAVDAVVYYRVQNATMSITNVEDANRSTRLLAATTLRNVLGTKNLAEILSERESISHLMQVGGAAEPGQGAWDRDMGQGARGQGRGREGHGGRGSGQEGEGTERKW